MKCKWKATFILLFSLFKSHTFKSISENWEYISEIVVQI